MTSTPWTLSPNYLGEEPYIIILIAYLIDKYKYLA
jgi:hypothetical protein